MALQNVTALVVSSDSLDCRVAEVATADGIVGGVVLHDGGFVVDEGSEELVASSFAVTFSAGDPSDRTGFARLVDERVDYREHPGLTEHQLGRCSQDPHQVRFLLELDHELGTATVTVRILLEPATFITLTEGKKTLWKSVIERAWSNTCKLVRTSGRAPSREYLIAVSVRWLSPGAPGADTADYRVEVRKGSWSTRANVGTWYLKNRNIVVAHEFGHMLGNIDEYDGTCDGCPDRPVFEWSIMAHQRDWPHPWPRHFWLIQQYVEQMTCSEFDAVMVDPREPVGSNTPRKTKDFWIDIGCEALLPFDPHRKLVT